MQNPLVSNGTPKATRNALGTINGCYIPCLLNILGAPLFLFVGFAVGMLGWPGALARPLRIEPPLRPCACPHH